LTTVTKNEVECLEVCHYSASCYSATFNFDSGDCALFSNQWSEDGLSSKMESKIGHKALWKLPLVAKVSIELNDKEKEKDESETDQKTSAKIEESVVKLPSSSSSE
jgi:hypothetical protein